MDKPCLQAHQGGLIEFGSIWDGIYIFTYIIMTVFNIYKSIKYYGIIKQKKLIKAQKHIRI